MAYKTKMKLNLKKGALTAKAKAAGMSLSKFEAKTLKKGSRASKLTKKQAGLAVTMKGWHHKGKKK
jgi:hypothetical protein